MLLTKFEKHLLLISTIIRLFTWLLAFIFDHSIEDHDHSTNLMLTTKENPQLSLPSYFLRCFVRWDSLFYLNQADTGYEYLKNHAFFPLFARLVRLLRDIIFSPFKSAVQPMDSLIITGITLNYFVHLANVIIFYRLSQVYLKNEKLAQKAALLFIISPASIFFSAFYTESLFCFFTFLGYYFLYKDEPFTYKNLSLATLFFCLSGFIRSNGNFYILLIGYQLLHRLIESVLKPGFSLNRKLFESFKIIAIGIVILILMNIPYVLVMRMPWKTYCKDFIEYPGAEKPSFCNSMIPNAYTYIQDKFWDVGFMTSWQPRKAFFVIWGIPMLVLMGVMIGKYYKRNLLNTVLLGIPGAINKKGAGEKNENDAFYMSKNIPSIILTTIMFVVNTFFAHINVSSRINSSNPLVYWYAAYALSVVKGIKGEGETMKWSCKNHLILYYFIFYMVTGCAVFTNFYLFV